MNLEQAKAYLNALSREELRDHAFGDTEVYWENAEGQMLAEGYYGSSGSHVGACDSSWRFSGKDAETLRACGKLTRVQRNDAGPQE